jgi:hypothetical protein
MELQSQAPAELENPGPLIMKAHQMLSLGQLWAVQKRGARFTEWTGTSRLHHALVHLPRHPRRLAHLHKCLDDLCRSAH